MLYNSFFGDDTVVSSQIIYISCQEDNKLLIWNIEMKIKAISEFDFF